MDWVFTVFARGDGNLELAGDKCGVEAEAACVLPDTNIWWCSVSVTMPPIHSWSILKVFHMQH